MAARYSQETIDNVRQASDIVDVISGYLTLHKKGKNYFGLCPFHQEKTPSFSVNPEMQIFHCFGCGEGGNVFTFIMRMEGLTFVETMRLLAKASDISLPEMDQDVSAYRQKEALFYTTQMAADFYLQSLLSDQGKKARDYLSQRGLLQEDYKEYGIGYAPEGWDHLLRLAKSRSLDPGLLLQSGLAIEKQDGSYYDRFRGRVTFAIHNLSGQIVGFGARRLLDDNSPKYINSPETEIYQKRQILYGLYLGRDFIRQEDNVLIVEGYTDLISLSKRGIKNAVATSGTALTENHVQLLRRYTTNAVLLYDSDSAGATAAIRGADLLLEGGMEVKICRLPQGQDPDEFVREKGPQAVLERLNRLPALIDFKLDEYRKKGQLDTAQHKARVTRELLQSIVKIADTIQRSFIVQDLAHKLHLDEAVLWSEMAQLERKTRSQSYTVSQAKSETEAFFSSKRGAAELGLLEIAFYKPAIIPKILEYVDLEEFSHAEIRYLFQQLQNSLSTQIQDVAASIRDPKIAKTISNILFKQNLNFKSEKYANDCVVFLKLAQIDDQIIALRKELQSKKGKESHDLLSAYKSLTEQRQLIENVVYIEEQ